MASWQTPPPSSSPCIRSHPPNRVARPTPHSCSTASWTATTHPLPSPTITARARLTPPVSKHHPPLPPHLFTPLLPYPRVDHHPAAGEHPRRSAAKTSHRCATSFSALAVLPRGKRKPSERTHTLQPPRYPAATLVLTKPRIAAKPPPHPLIHHPASARRSFLLPCPASKPPPPPSSKGTLASTRNAAKPPAASSVSWPATTQRHTNHTTAALALPPPVNQETAAPR